MSSFDLVAVVVVVIVFVVLGFVFEFDTLYGEYLVGVRFSFSAVVDYLFPLLELASASSWISSTSAYCSE